jgi:hypothetical protein
LKCTGCIFGAFRIEDLGTDDAGNTGRQRSFTGTYLSSFDRSHAWTVLVSFTLPRATRRTGGKALGR